ncbi:hypothetical protein IAE37_001914 [Pseudomonas sp. S31]|uniref:hypothetical protein n=1 Tax=Pseudomonas sp. S31 TaxID=1564473 RepID=UPI001914A4B6|nr:hypothetical protein [Pseudomonas sp. S31]MBK4999638.1 hypothetical protein [Pseudomonas sp. S31]
MATQPNLRSTFQPLVGDWLFQVVSFSLSEAVSALFRLTRELVSFEQNLSWGVASRQALIENKESTHE